MSLKAFVLGSEGNIGKPLVKFLRQKGYQILESDIKPRWRKDYLMADINHPVDLFPAFDWKPDIVFMLSSMVSRVTCEQASSLAIATNLGGLNNVFQLCKKVNAHTVFFSTSEVYGPNCEVMNESVSNPRPNNRYGLSKLLGEQLFQYEVENYNMKGCILRPFMMYDENEDFGDHRSAMVRFAFNLAKGIPVEVHKNTERGWLHVSDAVRVIEAAAHTKEFSVINIGSPDIRSIAELAELVRKEVNADEKLIKYVDMPGQMTKSKRPTLDRMTNLLKVTPLVRIEDGVKKVCQKVKERIRIENSF